MMWLYILSQVCLWAAIAANVIAAIRLFAMPQKLKDLYYEKGVIEGHGATRFPGEPFWKRAREILDKFEAELALKYMEQGLKEEKK